MQALHWINLGLIRTMDGAITCREPKKDVLVLDTRQH